MVGGPVDLAALYQDTKAQVEKDAATPDDARFVLSLVRAAIGKSAVLQETKGARGVQGEVACPCCGGGLRFSVARLNGHVWANCSTSDCVSFLE